MKANERFSFEHEDLTGLRDNNLAADQLLHHQQLTQYLDAQVEALPPKRRVIFQLSRHEHMTYKEIADYLDISHKTVENQIIAALKTLRQALSGYNK